MIETSDKPKPRQPSRVFVAVSSLAISAFAILIGHFHSLDKMFRESDLSGTWVRYADDIVIAAWGGGQHILKELRRMLGRLKLELSEEKTRVVNAEDGFDFLGVHFKLCPVTRPGKKLDKGCRVWPSDRSIKRIHEKRFDEGTGGNVLYEGTHPGA